MRGKNTCEGKKRGKETRKESEAKEASRGKGAKHRCEAKTEAT